MVSPPTKHSFAPVRPANPGEATFPHQLPIELALGLNPVPEICEAYGLTREEFAAIIQVEHFQAMYEWAMEEKNRPGGAFRLQMAMMGDEAAKVIFTTLTTVDSGLPLRMRAAELVAKFGGLEPPKQVAGVDVGERFAINISFTSPQPASSVTIDGTATPVPKLNVIRGR